MIWYLHLDCTQEGKGGLQGQEWDRNSHFLFLFSFWYPYVLGKRKGQCTVFSDLHRVLYINWNDWSKHVQYLQVNCLRRINKGVVYSSKTKRLPGEFFCTVEAFQVNSTTWHKNKYLGIQMKAFLRGEASIQCPRAFSVSRTEACAV